ncbi:AAA family ATPase [Nonomuraea sp. NPDC049152]|uniref:AAA family ATPase n=1 Tax=Nonomuraea sp. NPDC049152 TaxID=3154350 RepID=UPI0033EF9478
MEWHFVGRSQQLTSIRAALRAARPGSIVITGERGSGRSSLVEQALRSPEAAGYDVVRLDATVTADGIAGRVPSDPVKPLLLVVDDAHLSGHDSLLALRELGRRKIGTVLVTALSGEQARRPDPTDCLRFEPGTRSLALPPFTVGEVAALLSSLAGGHVKQATADALHAATRGNAALLRELLVGRGLGARLSRAHGGWEMQAVTEWRARPGTVGPPLHLVEATWQAWSALCFDRAYELCKAAAWCGMGHLVAVPLAHLLLLRGRPYDSMRFLDSLPAGVVENTPHLALARAINLACGLGSPAAAADFLRRAGSPSRPMYDAYRAWVMALTGGGTDGAARIERGDRESALFAHAAQAMVTLRVRPQEAVFHLRRALALLAGGMGAGPPWLTPHLTACLIDALLLAGRSAEATLLATGFHGGEARSGWDVAVAVSMVTTATAAESPAA